MLRRSCVCSAVVASQVASYTTGYDGGGILATTSATTEAVSWTPAQRSYRKLMKSIRVAFYHDRAKMFWARHRVKVQYYKYANATEQHDDVELARNEENVNESDDDDVRVLCNISDQVADFMNEYMPVSLERIHAHNDKMLTLPVEAAKRYRAEYLRKEHEHEVWCKQKIRTMLMRRPRPPYPYC